MTFALANSKMTKKMSIAHAVGVAAIVAFVGQTQHVSASSNLTQEQIREARLRRFAPQVTAPQVMNAVPVLQPVSGKVELQAENEQSQGNQEDENPSQPNSQPQPQQEENREENEIGSENPSQAPGVGQASQEEDRQLQELLASEFTDHMTQLLRRGRIPSVNNLDQAGRNLLTNFFNNLPQQQAPSRITRQAYQHDHYQNMLGVEGVHGETPTYTYHTGRPDGLETSALYNGAVQRVFNKIPLMHSYNPDHVDNVGTNQYQVGTGSRYHRQFFNGVFSVGPRPGNNDNQLQQNEQQNEAGNSDIQFTNLPEFLKKALENPALCAPNVNAVEQILNLRRDYEAAEAALRLLQQEPASAQVLQANRTTHSQRDDRQTQQSRIAAAQQQVDQLKQRIQAEDCSRKLELKKLNVVIADMREDAQSRYDQDLLYRPHYAIHHGTRDGVPYNEQTHLRVALGDSDFCEYVDPFNRVEWDFRTPFDYSKSTGNRAETDALIWDEYAWTHPDYNAFSPPQIASSYHNPLTFYTMQAAANNQPGNGNQQQQAHVKKVAAQESGSWFAVHNAIPWGNDMSRTDRRLDRDTGRPEPKGSDIVNFNDGEPSANSPLQNKTNEVVATFYWKIKSNISHPLVPKPNNSLTTAESKLLDVLGSVNLAGGSVDSLRNGLKHWATQQQNTRGSQQAARLYNLIRPAGENAV